MPGDVIRVVLADDHAVVRAGLRAVLSVARDIEVIGEAKNGREAVVGAKGTCQRFSRCRAICSSSLLISRFCSPCPSAHSRIICCSVRI